MVTISASQPAICRRHVLLNNLRDKVTLVSGALCHEENSSLPRGGRLGEDNHQLTPLSREDVEGTDAVSHHDKSTLPPGSPLLRTNNQVTSGSQQSCPFEQLSFSLGLTQDKDAPAPREDDQMGENESELAVETQHDTIISRKRQTYADSPTVFTKSCPRGTTLWG
ncbi:hypothetical protein YC2023_089484 [Brassica napus]